MNSKIKRNFNLSDEEYHEREKNGFLNLTNELISCEINDSIKKKQGKEKK